MKKRLLPLVLVAPAAANAGYVDYEMLDGGTIQLGGKLYTRDITATLTQGSAKTDISSTGYRLDVEMLGGISRDLNVDFKISPVGQTETEFPRKGRPTPLSTKVLGI